MGAIDGQLTAPLLEFLNCLITKELNCSVLSLQRGSPEAELPRFPWDVPFPLLRAISATQSKIQPCRDILDLGFFLRLGFWWWVFGFLGFGLRFFVCLFVLFWVCGLVWFWVWFFFWLVCFGVRGFFLFFSLFGGCCCQTTVRWKTLVLTSFTWRLWC